MEHVGTLLSLFLAPKLGMDNTQSMLLSKVVDSCVSSVAGSRKTKERISKALGRYKYPLTVGIPVCYFAWKYASYFQRLTRSTSTEDIIYDVYDNGGITTFSQLFKNYTELFEIRSVEHGTYKNTGDSLSWVLPSVDTTFRLPDENVMGIMCAMYIPTSKIQNKYDDNENVCSSESIKIEKLFIRITLVGNIISYAHLLRIAEQYYSRYLDGTRERTVKLFGVTVFRKYSSQSGMSTENIQSTILEMPRSEYNREMYFDNYFSSKKSELMTYCTLDQCNLLLHGPAGTGKSVLIHTMAMYTERHIVNLDLTVLTKREAYQILSCARIDGKAMQPHQYIIVFEEFDNTIRVFRDRERAKKLEEKEVRGKGAFSFAKYKSSNLSAIKDNPDDSQLLRISDLLALFQSCVPRKGQMMIATTNHFKKINKVLPALFRPGRMTPMLIGYADRKTISELVTHHFPDTIEIPVLQRGHRLSTSRIVEIAGIYRSDYTKFEKRMRQDILELPPEESSETTDSDSDDDYLTEPELGVEDIPDEPTVEPTITPGSVIMPHPDSGDEDEDESGDESRPQPGTPTLTRPKSDVPSVFTWESDHTPTDPDEPPSDWAVSDPGCWQELARTFH